MSGNRSAWGLLVPAAALIGVFVLSWFRVGEVRIYGFIQWVLIGWIAHEVQERIRHRRSSSRKS